MPEIDREKLSAKLDEILEADREPYLKELQASGYTWKLSPEADKAQRVKNIESSFLPRTVELAKMAGQLIGHSMRLGGKAAEMASEVPGAAKTALKSVGEAVGDTMGAATAGVKDLASRATAAVTGREAPHEAVDRISKGAMALERSLNDPLSDEERQDHPIGTHLGIAKPLRAIGTALEQSLPEYQEASKWASRSKLGTLANKIQDAAAIGIARLEGSLAKMPALAYDLAHFQKNLGLKIAGREDLQVRSPEWLANSYAAKFWDDESKAIAERNPEATADIQALLRSGRFSDAGKSLAFQVVQQAPQQAFIIASTIAGMPGPGLVAMGAMTAAEVNARSRNVDPVMGTLNATIQGTAEGLFERMGTSSLVKYWGEALSRSVGRKAAMEVMRDFAKTIVASAWGEGKEELLTQGVQDFSDYATGTNPKALGGIGGRMINAGIIGAASGATITTGGAIVSGELQSQIENVKAERVISGVKQAVSGNLIKNFGDIESRMGTEATAPSVMAAAQEVSLASAAVLNNFLDDRINGPKMTAPPTGLSKENNPMPAVPAAVAINTMAAGVLGPEAEAFARDFPFVMAVANDLAQVPPELSVRWENAGLVSLSTMLRAYADGSLNRIQMANLDRDIFISTARNEGVPEELLEQRWADIRTAAEYPAETLVSHHAEKQAIDAFSDARKRADEITRAEMLKVAQGEPEAPKAEETENPEAPAAIPETADLPSRAEAVRQAVEADVPLEEAAAVHREEALKAQEMGTLDPAIAHEYAEAGDVSFDPEALEAESVPLPDTAPHPLDMSPEQLKVWTAETGAAPEFVASLRAFMEEERAAVQEAEARADERARGLAPERGLKIVRDQPISEKSLRILGLMGEFRQFKQYGLVSGKEEHVEEGGVDKVIQRLQAAGLLKEDATPNDLAEFLDDKVRQKAGGTLAAEETPEYGSRTSEELAELKAKQASGQAQGISGPAPEEKAAQIQATQQEQSSFPSAGGPYDESISAIAGNVKALTGDVPLLGTAEMLRDELRNYVKAGLTVEQAITKRLGELDSSHDAFAEGLDDMLAAPLKIRRTLFGNFTRDLERDVLLGKEERITQKLRENHEAVRKSILKDLTPDAVAEPTPTYGAEGQGFLFDEAGNVNPDAVAAPAEAGQQTIEARGVEAKEPEVIDEESYLATHGASRQDIGDAALHKNIPEGRVREQLAKRQGEKDADLLERREALRKEYQEKVAAGEIRPPTRDERLISTAQGREENEATQAARRVLEKRGIDWRPKGSDTPQDVGEELWYNRRNLVGKGLKWEDIREMNPTMKALEVQKVKVWPRPDYEALVAGGMKNLTAHIVKQVYDAITTKPNVSGAATDAQMEAYIAEVERVKEAVYAWAKDPAAQMDMFQKFAKMAETRRKSSFSMIEMMGQEVNSLLDAVYPENADGQRWGSRNQEQNDRVVLIGGKKVAQAMNLGLDSAVDALKAIDKGWPAPQEAWEKRFVIKEEPAGTRVKRGGQVVETDKPTFSIRGAGKSSRYHVFAEDLPTREAAVAKAKELAASKTTSRVSAEQNLEHFERQGPPRRPDGLDVTPKALQDTFGFRGVNFGNYTNPGERQAFLNNAYDSLLDLAELLQIPARAVSLNGILGLAYGAQGKGGKFNAAAHFVPGVNEINLTKDAGAGSLAHEWWHALDHYFAVQASDVLAKNGEPYLSHHTTDYAGTGKFSGLRPEILKAFKDIVEVMSKTPETPEQVQTRLAAWRKDSVNRLDRWIKHFRDRLDAFGRSKYEPGKGYVKVELGAKEVAVRANHLQQFDLLAEGLRKGLLGKGYEQIGRGRFSSVHQNVGEIRRLYKDVTGHVPSPEDIKALDAAAYSVKRLDDEDRAVESLKPLMVRSEYLKDAGLLDAGKSKPYWTMETELGARAFQSYVLDKLEAEARRNDYLSRPQLPTKLYVELEGGDRYPRGEERKKINAAFDAMVRELKTKETEKGIAIYEKGPAYGPAPTFYSKLQRDVNAQLPEKATVEQVRALLRGQKAEEVAWSGIDEFLKGKEKVSKAELLELLRANQLEIKEVMKGEGVPSDQESAGRLRVKLDDIKRAVGTKGYVLEEDPGGMPGEVIVSKAGSDDGLDIDDLPEDVGNLVGEFQEKARDLSNIEGGFGVDGGTKFKSYTLPGGENYRELLLTLPEEPADTSGWTAKPGAGDPASGPIWEVRDARGKWVVGVPRADVATPEAAIKGAAERHRKSPANFYSSHFDEPNILAHIRFNDRTVKEPAFTVRNKASGNQGPVYDTRAEAEAYQKSLPENLNTEVVPTTAQKKVLFIEEVQSDWHQKGRREGYKKEITKAYAEELGYSVYKTKSNLGTDAYFLEGPEYPRGIPNQGSETEEAAWDSLLSFLKRNSPQVPDAPLKKTWHEFALKRMIRYAAENGYDKIAWTTGTQQVARYPEELRKIVDKLSWGKEGYAQNNVLHGFKNGSKAVSIQFDSQGLVMSTTPRGMAAGKHIAEMVGKDIAAKILSTPQGGDLEGKDFTVGGEGMKGFYDKIVPDFLRKFGKKFGAEVGESLINLGPESPSGLDPRHFDVPVGRANRPTQVHSMPITPALRKAAIEEGFSLFAEQPSYGLTSDKMGGAVSEGTGKEYPSRPHQEKGENQSEGGISPQGSSSPSSVPPASTKVNAESTTAYGPGANLHDIALAIDEDVFQGISPAAKDLADLFRKHGTVPLEGLRITNLKSIEENIRFIRNRQTEVHVGAFKVDGRVVESHIHSAGLPSTVPAMEAIFKIAKAWCDVLSNMHPGKKVSYESLHNHPVGNERLSDEDLTAGARAREILGDYFDGLGATDDIQYETTTGLGDRKTVAYSRPMEKFPQRGTTPIHQPSVVAALAVKNLKEGDAHVVLVTDNDGRLLKALSFPKDADVPRETKRAIQVHRGSQAFVATLSMNRSLPDYGAKFASEVRHVIGIDKNGKVTSPGYLRQPGFVPEELSGESAYAPTKTWRLAEDLPKYMGGQGMDQADFAKVLEESKLKVGAPVTARVAFEGIKKGETGVVAAIDKEHVRIGVVFGGNRAMLLRPENLVETYRRPAARVALEAAQKAERVSGQPQGPLRNIVNRETGVNAEQQMVVMTEAAALRKKFRDEERGARAAFLDGQRSLRHAIKESMVQGKWEEATRKKVVEYAKAYLPPSERGALLTKVAEAKTHADFLNAFWYIDQRANLYANKETLKDIRILVDRIQSSPTFPVQLKIQMRELLSDVRLENWTTKTLDILHAQQTIIETLRAEGQNVDVPKALLRKLEKMTKRPLAEIDPAETAEILADLRFLAQRGAELRAAGVEMAELDRLETLDDLVRGTKKIEYASTTGAAQRKFGAPALTWAQEQKNRWLGLLDFAQSAGIAITPVQAILDDLDGTFLGGGPNRRLWDRLQDGYISKIGEEFQAESVLADLIMKHGVLNQQERDRILTVAYREQRDVRPHLHKMGVGDAEIDAVKLTPKEQGYLDGMRAYFARPENHASLARITADLYNEEFVPEENYFPIMTKFDPTDPGANAVEIMREELALRRKNVNRGRIIQRRVGAARKIRTDLENIFLDAAKQQANLKYMADPIIKAHGLVNDPAYLEAGGDAAQDFWKDFLDTLARDGKKPRTKTDMVVGLLRRNLGKAALTFKPHVALVQLSSLGTGSTLAGAANVAKAINAGKEWDGFVDRNMPLVAGRRGGDPAVREATSGEILGKVAEVGFRHMVATDHWTAKQVALGAYFQYLANSGIEADPLNPNKEALAYAQSVIGRSMASPWLIDMPLALSRGGEVTKAALQFQSETLAAFRLMKDLARQVPGQPIGAAEDISILGATFMYEAGVRMAWRGAVMMALLGLGAITQRQYYEFKKKEDAYWKQVFFSVMQKLPFVGSVANSLKYGSGPVPVVDVGLDALKGLGNTVMGGINHKPIMAQKGIVQAATALAMLAGVPGSSVVGWAVKQTLRGKRDKRKPSMRMRP